MEYKQYVEIECNYTTDDKFRVWGDEVGIWLSMDIDLPTNAEPQIELNKETLESLIKGLTELYDDISGEQDV